MAEVKENILTEGLSGKIGNKIVFRQLGNRTIVSARPRKQAGSELTGEQAEHRNRFRQAVVYAKAKMLDPAEKEQYEQMAKQYKHTGAFAAAVGDYLKGPEITAIDTTGYTGSAGDAIMITIANNFKVTSLSITITQPDGRVLESGEAGLTPGNLAWKYVATSANAALAGTTIKAVAADRPGNQTTLEKVLD